MNEWAYGSCAFQWQAFGRITVLIADFGNSVRSEVFIRNTKETLPKQRYSSQRHLIRPNGSRQVRFKGPFDMARPGEVLPPVMFEGSITERYIKYAHINQIHVLHVIRD